MLADVADLQAMIKQAIGQPPRGRRQAEPYIGYFAGNQAQICQRANPDGHIKPFGNQVNALVAQIHLDAHLGVGVHELGNRR